jgi:hypothetical protein
MKNLMTSFKSATKETIAVSEAIKGERFCSSPYLE